MKPQPHSWMPYLYKYKADNDNYRMWIRDSHRIYQTSDNTFVAADQGGWLEGSFSSFEEAEKAFTASSK